MGTGGFYLKAIMLAAVEPHQPVHKFRMQQISRLLDMRHNSSNMLASALISLHLL
jgi:hypothetical protein